MEDTAIGALSRNLDSLDGDLAATTKTGNTVLLLANLHGDEHPRTASRHQRGPTALTTDEYGNPRTGQAATRYQWIVTAGKTEDGGAVGRIEPDAAGFMRARHGDDYDRPTDELWEKVKEADGEHVSTSRYPLLYVPDSWEVMSMLELLAPGVDHRTATGGGERTVWMLHPDGSWARATAAGFLDSPTVHQGGPRRLWDELERIRHRLNREGGLPVYGARVRISPDGVLTLSRGGWSVTVNRRFRTGPARLLPPWRMGGAFSPRGRRPGCRGRRRSSTGARTAGRSRPARSAGGCAGRCR